MSFENKQRRPLWNARGGWGGGWGFRRALRERDIRKEGVANDKWNPPDDDDNEGEEEEQGDDDDDD